MLAEEKRENNGIMIKFLQFCSDLVSFSSLFSSFGSSNDKPQNPSLLPPAEGTDITVVDWDIDKNI